MTDEAAAAAPAPADAAGAGSATASAAAPAGDAGTGVAVRDTAEGGPAGAAEGEPAGAADGGPARAAAGGSAGAAEGGPARAAAGGPNGPAAGELWRLVDVVDVALTLPAAFPEVVLRERPPPNRELRMPLGMAEGTALAYAWRRIGTPRPLTHELVVDVLSRHGVRVEAVRITGVERGTFLAELDTTGPAGRQLVPCRPSDALSIALRTRPVAPVLVADEVFAAAAAGA